MKCGRDPRDECCRNPIRSCDGRLLLIVQNRETGNPIVLMVTGAKLTRMGDEERLPGQEQGQPESW
ncbi:MAG: hypothetical protein OXD47_03045 [Gammaproteobacteria bacterium]|nr:hypothetical protein [Gammaproteobacteria bacterium]MCY4283563.1 hypothetical protein [Gammaproteobacteria bacterium]MCY4337757.1 hypothetical protein [Gammaproteobacteria bacterium]